MELQELKRKNKFYADQIDELIKQQKSFQQDNKSTFNQLFKNKQLKDYDWFVRHFDYVWKHRELLKCKDPFKNIVIDFLTLYKSAGLAGGAAFSGSSDKVFLGNLITMWENGLTHNNYPIISVEEYIHQGNTIIISYIKDNQVWRETFGSKANKPFDRPLFKKYTEMIRKYNISESKLSLWEDYQTIDILKGLVKA